MKTTWQALCLPSHASWSARIHPVSFPFHFPLKVVSAEAPDGLNCPLSLPLARASSFFLCLDNGKVLQSFGMPCLSPQGNQGGFYFFFFNSLSVPASLGSLWGS